MKVENKKIIEILIENIPKIRENKRKNIRNGRLSKKKIEKHSKIKKREKLKALGQKVS